MSSPVSRLLIGSYEVGTDASNLYQTTTGGGTTAGTPVTTNGQNVSWWDPLPQGNTLSGIRDVTAVGIYHTGDFANGLGGIRGTGSTSIFSLNALAALVDFDVFCVFHTLGVTSVNNDRLISNGTVAASFNVLFATGTTTTVTGGVMEGSSPFGGVLACADPAAHIVHLSHRVASSVGTRLVEIDGHTVNSSATVAATAVTPSNLYLFNSTTGGSGSQAAIGTVYVYGDTTLSGGNGSGGLTTLEINQIFNSLGTNYSITLAGVPATGGGYRRRRGGFADMTGM